MADDSLYGVGVTPATRDEIAVLAARAGLTLSPVYFQELVESYSHLERLLSTLRRFDSSEADPASLFMVENVARKSKEPKL